MKEEKLNSLLKREVINKDDIKEYLTELLKDTNENGWVVTSDWCGFAIEEAYKLNVDCKFKQNRTMIENIANKVISIQEDLKKATLDKELSFEDARDLFNKYFQGIEFPWFDCNLDGIVMKLNLKQMIFARMRRLAKLYEIKTPFIILNNELFNLTQGILVNEYGQSIKIYYPNEYTGEE